MASSGQLLSIFLRHGRCWKVTFDSPTASLPMPPEITKPLPDVAMPKGPEILEPGPAELPAIPEVQRPLTIDPARTEPDPTPSPPDDSPSDPPVPMD